MPFQNAPVAMMSSFGRPEDLSGKKSGVSYARFYAHVAFFTCICLQRFGAHFGTSSLSLSTPVLIGLSLAMLMFGRARISTGSMLLFLAFAIWGVLSTWGATLWPDPRVGFSLVSYLNVLAVYVTLTVRPTNDIDGAVVLRVFLFYVRLCAVLGIVEFGLQFAGVHVFSFADMLPLLRPVLLESDWAVNSMITYGSTIQRSNGFFLLEPSIFSQYLAVAIVIDFVLFRRAKYLLLYLIAFMTSYSGTGLLSLGAALSVFALSSGRNLTRAVALGIAALAVVVIFALIFPDQVAIFLGRFTEINSEGSSGNARFLGQFQEIRDLGGDARALLGYGPGATQRSRFYIPGSNSAYLNLFIDYGPVGLVLFFIFLLRATWNKQAPALSTSLLVTFLLGGGYLLFVQYLFTFVAISIWGRWVPGMAREAAPVEPLA